MRKVGTFFLALIAVLGCLCSCGNSQGTQENPEKTQNQETSQFYSELELASNRIELLVGESANIVAENSNEDLSYSSSNEAVTVDKDGKVTAVQVGSACITVTGKTAKGVCVVIVSDTLPVKLEKLEINSDVTTLSVGDTKELVFNKTPINADDYNSIRWSSDNEEIASVTKDGVVIAKKAGTVNITVVATGTNFSDKITITVNARQSTLKFKHEDITGLVGEKPFELETKLFTDYSDVVVGGFVSKNPSVATVSSDGKVTFVGTGKTEITYTVTAGGEKLEAKCKVAVIEKAGYTVIRTPEELQAIGNKSGNYMLGNDIDLAEACAKGGSLYYAGLGFSPLFNKKAEAFKGTFDGMGYSIKNLYINRPETPFVALFGYINVNKGSEGLICNLALEGGKIEGGNHVSAFVAYHNGSGSANAGVKNCWTDIEIVAHGNHAGGIISYNGGMIENCYSLSKISGSGLLASISHNVAESNEIGVKNTYVANDTGSMATWLVYENNLRESTMLAQYKSTAELKQATLYSSWNSNIWSIEDGSLPTLKTENDR